MHNNNPPTENEISAFLNHIDFKLPDNFIDFFRKANGSEINKSQDYIVLWPIRDIIDLNKKYNVELFAPGFFIFGSDGGGTAYAIEKDSGNVYDIPFIGMSKDDAVLKNKSFLDFINSLG